VKRSLQGAVEVKAGQEVAEPAGSLHFDNVALPVS